MISWTVKATGMRLKVLFQRVSVLNLLIVIKKSEDDYSCDCGRKIRPNGSFTQGNGVQVVRRVKMRSGSP